MLKGSTEPFLLSKNSKSFRAACDVESSFLFIIGRCHDYLNRGIVVIPDLIRYPLLFPLSRHSRGAYDEESLLMGLD